MYADFFGFRELPFNNTPDPRFFFATPDHEEGLASLIYAVKERKGFVLLTGEVGTGKTLVTRMMLRHFGTQLSFANISHGIQNPVELMESICTEFELECEPGASATQLIRTLHDFLLGQFAQDIPVVLVLDEAQNLPVQAFEQLRMIGNLEADDAKLLQIAIVGQPELQRRFLSPKLRQLRQRIFRSYHLPALSRDMADQYIRHRLSIVTDANDEVFDAGALSEIFRISQGLPRIINTICDNALLSAYSVGKRKIDGPFVESVVSQMMILGEPSQEQRHAPLQSPSRSGGGTRAIAERPGPAAGETPPATTVPVNSPRVVADIGPRESLPGKEAAFAQATRAERGELADLSESLEKHRRETSSQVVRTEQLVSAVAKECSKAQTLHASLAGMLQTVTHATARAEAVSRTVEHRDAQLRNVSATVSDLVRNLRSLLDRARETTADVVTVERGARKTYGRLSDQINGAGRLAEELTRLSDRIIPAIERTPPYQVQPGSTLLNSVSTPVAATVNEPASRFTDALRPEDAST
ncbi:MAG: AAA family ATPase, partial [Planctomycetes bacterium]|nr:AAA family ATPase [Planctomycetota bacterium]